MESSTEELESLILICLVAVGLVKPSVVDTLLERPPHERLGSVPVTALFQV
jgi:hypothetical protein